MQLTTMGAAPASTSDLLTVPQRLEHAPAEKRREVDSYIESASKRQRPNTVSMGPERLRVIKR